MGPSFVHFITAPQVPIVTLFRSHIEGAVHSRSHGAEQIKPSARSIFKSGLHSYCNYTWKHIPSVLLITMFCCAQALSFKNPQVSNYTSNYPISGHSASFCDHCRAIAVIGFLPVTILKGELCTLKLSIVRNCWGNLSTTWWRKRPMIVVALGWSHQ